MTRYVRNRCLMGAAIAGLLLPAAIPAAAQTLPTAVPDQAPPLPAEAETDRIEEKPEALRQVGVDERLNAELPLDIELTDHTGATVRLGDYFDGKRPVILTLNYYRCPQLCGIQLNNLVDTLKRMDMTAGKDFQIVTVSFDPLEPHHFAAAKRTGYLGLYDRPEAAGGWHFTVGRKKAIDRLLDATGYRIQYVEKTGEWAHAAALIFCTPDGRISRYLVNILYEPRTVRLSLVEASEGKIGTTMDHVMLFCFQFDGEGYSLAAFNIVRGGAALSAVGVGILLLVLWSRERRRRKAGTSAP